MFFLNLEAKSIFLDKESGLFLVTYPISNFLTNTDGNIFSDTTHSCPYHKDSKRDKPNASYLEVNKPIFEFFIKLIFDFPKIGGINLIFLQFKLFNKLFIIFLFLPLNELSTNLYS